MSPGNPCKVKVTLQHLNLYIKDLIKINTQQYSVHFPTTG